MSDISQQQQQLIPKRTHIEFLEDIQKWELLDSQLKIVTEKTKKMREMKQILSKRICDYIDTNPQYKMKTTIRVYEKREYTPLTYGYIQECLEQIIKNPEHIDYILDYLKENREVKITQDIRKNGGK